jgi:LAGLIDADG DNA endonuclease family protein
VGIILGDRYLERIKFSYNTRLRIEQSYPEKEKYFNSLYSLFEPLVTMSPVILTRKPEKRTGKIYKSIYFRTLTLLCLNKYHDI